MKDQPRALARPLNRVLTTGWLIASYRDIAWYGSVAERKAVTRVAVSSGCEFQNMCPAPRMTWCRVFERAIEFRLQ
jgi:hypothetical protein